MFLYYPFREVLQYDKDEGLSLMMARLVEDGYQPYDDIWSDHPPLFTYMLVAVFRVAGMEVNSGRLLVLIVSSILVWAGFQILRWIWGAPHAIAGAVLFFLLPWYLRLSVSVMIGLPSIALAMLALLALIRWHFTNKSVWLILSAMAMCCSVLIKVFTGLLVPIFLVGILAEQYSHQRGEALQFAKSHEKEVSLLRRGSASRELISAAAIWLAVFTALTALLGFFLVGPGNLVQLLLPHLEATGPGLFDEVQYSINVQIQQALPILGLSLVGALFSLKTKRWLSLYLLAWMVVAYLLLTQHSPVWYHHQLLVTVPGTLLAAAAVGEGLRVIGEMIRQRKLLVTRSILAAVSLLGFVYIVYAETPDLFNQLRDVPVWTDIEFSAGPYKEKVLKRMIRYAPQTHWVVTDLPMYAFRAGLPVPPNLAVFTTKRIKTGNLTEEEIVETMQTYQPEEVLFTQPYFPGITQYLNENYRLVRSQNTFNLYIRKDITE
jgi:4-amino-4-deoxy-L-arabinose transferase-like glycosyltransferase